MLARVLLARGVLARGVLARGMLARGPAGSHPDAGQRVLTQTDFSWVSAFMIAKPISRPCPLSL